MIAATKRLPTSDDLETMTAENGWRPLCKIFPPEHRNCETGLMYETDTERVRGGENGFRASDNFAQCLSDYDLDAENGYFEVMLRVIYSESDLYYAGDAMLIVKELSIDEVMRSLNGKFSVAANEEWWKNGKLHRDGDQPAVTKSNGVKKWYQNGEKHREGDLPAVICPNGHQEWWKNGKLHRDGDRPAVISPDGLCMWYKRGELRREGNNPAVARANDISNGNRSNGNRSDEFLTS